MPMGTGVDWISKGFAAPISTRRVGKREGYPALRVRLKPFGQSTQHNIMTINCNDSEEISMLCISLRPSEYFTVGKDTVIQFDKLSGDRAYLNIQAPREIPIVRGEVLERQGGQRPDCIKELSPRHIRQLPWDHAKKQALAELRQMVEEMGDSPEAQAMREKLDRIFPQSFDAAKTSNP